MIEAFRSKLAELHRVRGQKILDVGGWHAPCRQATHMADIMPYESLKLTAAHGEGPVRILPGHYHQLHFRRWPWQKMRERYANTFLLWEGTLRFEERVIIDYREVQADLRVFKRAQRSIRPFHLRWQRDE
ncbi:MAG TPA: hypothetical protein VGQ17_14680 [Gemmatimonadales bacterium]|jgi:hypothetical protein|nr:hypothetical protein [Gemmatimonadales bacterium]